MLKRILFILLLFCTIFLNAQYREVKVKLSEELNEISGLEIINDTLLVCHNDSGNKPEIYFISTDGNIQHKTFITNVKNVDWEDLTQDDKGNLYIADVGNNLNSRKDLCIYKVKISEALKNDSVNAEIISIRYEDQLTFLPTKENLNYDCESIYWKADSLYLVSKSRSKPWVGSATIYSLPTKQGEHTAVPIDSILVGNKRWQKDAVTSADVLGNILCLLTYNRMVLFKYEKGEWQKCGSHKFKKYNQKEALVMESLDKIYVATEKHPLLGGPYLYIIRKK